MAPEVTDQLTDTHYFLCRYFRKERGLVVSFHNRRYFERAGSDDDDSELLRPPQ